MWTFGHLNNLGPGANMWAQGDPNKGPGAPRGLMGIQMGPRGASYPMVPQKGPLSPIGPMVPKLGPTVPKILPGAPEGLGTLGPWTQIDPQGDPGPQLGPWSPKLGPTVPKSGLGALRAWRPRGRARWGKVRGKNCAALPEGPQLGGPARRF